MAIYPAERYSTKRVDARAIFTSGNELLELVKASGGHIRQLGSPASMGRADRHPRNILPS